MKIRKQNILSFLGFPIGVPANTYSGTAVECSVATAPWELNATEDAMELNATYTLGPPGVHEGWERPCAPNIQWPLRIGQYWGQHGNQGLLGVQQREGLLDNQGPPGVQEN